MSPYQTKTRLQNRSSSYITLTGGKPPGIHLQDGGPEADLSLPCLRVPQAVAERAWAHPSLSGLPSSSKHSLVQVCTKTNGWWVRLVFKAGASSPSPSSKDLTGD